MKVKKILSILLCALVIIGVFAGCGGTNATSSDVSSDVSETSSKKQNLGGFGNQFVMSNPSGKFYYTEKVDISWANLREGQTVSLKIEKKQGNSYTTILDKKGLTGDSFKSNETLAEGNYRILLQAVSADGSAKNASNTKGEGFEVEVVHLKKNSTVNKGKDFTFNGSISLNVLNNYLDRAITYCVYADNDANRGKFDTEVATDAMRAILNVGAKHIARTVGSWIPSKTEESAYPQIEDWITKMHEYDPEIIFEACIFETCTEKMNTIAIPDWVFKAFGKKAENRNFDSKKMIFKEGYGANQWGNGIHVPDITNEETQMWFYYRACQYIDMGIESIHLGQANLIGKNDVGLKNWTKVVHLIRDYAKKNARRKYVLINCHYPSQNFVGTDGVMLADFNAFPIRITAAKGEKDHAVSENNPQKCEINVNSDARSLYTGAISGKSPSGWTTNHYPYLVEFDNDGGEGNNKAEAKWGYDEIGWYANQPQWYRQKFIKDVNAQVKGFGNNGHVALPGRRTAYISEKKARLYYVMNDAKYYENGFSDEQGIINAWK